MSDILHNWGSPKVSNGRKTNTCRSCNLTADFTVDGTYVFYREPHKDLSIAVKTADYDEEKHPFRYCSIQLLSRKESLELHVIEI